MECFEYPLTYSVQRQHIFFKLLIIDISIEAYFKYHDMLCVLCRYSQSSRVFSRPFPQFTLAEVRLVSLQYFELKLYFSFIIAWKCVSHRTIKHYELLLISHADA